MKIVNWVKLIVLFGLLTAGGCEVPAQLHWSPDGKKAAWWKPDRQCLIDEQGKIIQLFDGASQGGFAWSADSSILYHATAKDTGMTVCALRDGQSVELFSLANRGILYMILSPDQNWLALVTQQKARDKTFELFAYSMTSKKLYPLATSCGLGICYTGPSRLAWLSPAREDANLDSLLGTLVETNLDESRTEFEQSTLAHVVPAATPWLQALGEDILLTAAPMSLPGKPSEHDAMNLYYLSRADGSITSIAEDIGPLFAPSPDGKRILFEKKTPREGQSTKAELAIMNSNGSDVHVLRDNTDSGLPMWPAWRGNDEIAFVGPMEDAKTVTDDEKTLLLFDVVLYRISPEYTLEPIRTLSQTWEDGLKPSRKRNGIPASQPATEAIQ